MGYYNMMGYFGWGSNMYWGWFLFPLMVWSLAWKGMALWKAAKAGSKEWFVVLLILNTVGILDILYLYIFSEKSKSNRSSSK